MCSRNKRDSQLYPYREYTEPKLEIWEEKQKSKLEKVEGKRRAAEERGAASEAKKTECGILKRTKPREKLRKIFKERVVSEHMSESKAAATQPAASAGERTTDGRPIGRSDRSSKIKQGR